MTPTPHHMLRLLAELRQRELVAEVERDRLVHQAGSPAGSVRLRERRAERLRRLAYVVSLGAAIVLALLAALASIRDADALVVPSPLPPAKAAAACGAATEAAAGRFVVTLAAGKARVGRADAEDGPLAPCVPATLSPGDWLAVQPGAVLAARNAGSAPASAVASTLVELPVFIKV